MTLPTDDKSRKEDWPLWDFMFGYFPKAWLKVVEVAVQGNKQHNPGEPLHWARGKSMDQLNTAFRHLFDYGTGTKVDSDGVPHLAKAIWRLMAQLQLDVEEEEHERRQGHGRGNGTRNPARDVDDEPSRNGSLIASGEGFGSPVDWAERGDIFAVTPPKSGWGWW